jgi:hypothetical protein
MNGEEIQQQLQVAYADWKRSLHLENEVAAHLSPPLLLSVPPGYTNARRRILVFGQETYRWDWTRDLRVRYANYPVDYPYENVCTMQDFLANNDCVEALCWGYREFDFANNQPVTWRSPFWRAFREVQDWPDAGLIWNNLSRCDYQGESVLKAPGDLQTRLLECQRELVAKELAILQPHVCLFVTGPNYDNLLSEVFPKCELTELVEDIPVRQFARIKHPRLPASSFRTYHPRYLSRGGHWRFLAKLRQFALAET